MGIIARAIGNLTKIELDNPNILCSLDFTATFGNKDVSFWILWSVCVASRIDRPLIQKAKGGGLETQNRSGFFKVKKKYKY